MSWTNFILYLSIAYFLYYAFNILIDFYSAKKTMSPNSSSTERSTHYQILEMQQPIDVSKPSVAPQVDFSGAELLSSGETESSGAQRLDQLMEAASRELIECTKRML